MTHLRKNGAVSELRFFNLSGKLGIYQFDKTMSLQSTKPYPIKDIAYENFMYELHDEKGKIVHTNYIERCLGEYESKFNKYRNIMINNFSLHKSCSEDSKEYWTDYIALQLPEFATS